MSVKCLFLTTLIAASTCFAAPIRENIFTTNSTSEAISLTSGLKVDRLNGAATNLTLYSTGSSPALTISGVITGSFAGTLVGGATANTNHENMLAGNSTQEVARASAALGGALLATNRFASDRSINLAKTPRIRQRLADGLPLRLLFLRDDAIQIEGRFIDALTSYMPLNGAGWRGYSWLWYADGAGQTWHNYDGFDFFWAGGYNTFNNTGYLTNIVNATTPATTLELRAWQGPGLGSLAIYTNEAGATPVQMATVICTNGSSVTAFRTNFFFPKISNGRWKLVSSGSNIVAAVCMYDTNRNAGVVMSMLSGADISVDTWMNGVNSNSMCSFLTGDTIDAIIFTDQSTSNALYTGAANWESALSRIGANPDLIYCTEAYVAAIDAECQAARDGIINAGYAFNRPVLDLMSFLIPDRAANHNNGDVSQVHLSTFANAMLGDQAVRMLSLWPNPRIGLADATNNDAITAANMTGHVAQATSGLLSTNGNAGNLTNLNGAAIRAGTIQPAALGYKTIVKTNWAYSPTLGTNMPGVIFVTSAAAHSLYSVAFCYTVTNFSSWSSDPIDITPRFSVGGDTNTGIAWQQSQTPDAVGNSTAYKAPLFNPDAGTQISADIQTVPCEICDAAGEFIVVLILESP